MDTFICGVCNSHFKEMNAFLSHKNASCQETDEVNYVAPLSEIDSSDATRNQNIDEHINLHHSESYITGRIAGQELTHSPLVTETLAHNGDTDLPKPVLVPNDGRPIIYVCLRCNMYATELSDLKQHHSDMHKTPEDSIQDAIVSLRPLNKAVSLSSNVKRKRGRPRKYPRAEDSLNYVKTGQVTVIGSEKLTVVSVVTKSDKTEGTGRKRGRPKKTVLDKDREKRSQDEKREQKKAWMDKENMTCRNCEKTFRKLRQLASHRCHKAGYVESSDDQCASDTEGDGIALVDPQPGGDDPARRDPLDAEYQTLMTLAEHKIPQVLNDNALPDSRINKPDNLKYFACPYCKKLFKSKQHVLLHVRSHTNERPHQCSECDYSSTLKCNLKAHITRWHTNERLSCVECSYSSHSKASLKKHRAKHGCKRAPVYCDLCSQRAYTNSNLLRHLETKHDIHTDRQAKSYYDKKKLLCRVGRRNLIFECNICSRKFKEKRNHDQHLILHQKNKPFRCTMCPYTAMRYAALETHAKRHWFVYICHLCSCKFLSLELLKAHLAAHDRQDDVSDSDLLEQSVNTSVYQSDSIDKELLVERQRKESLKDSNHLSPIKIDLLECHENDLDGLCKIKSGSNYLKYINTPLVKSSDLKEIGEMFTKFNFRRLSLDLLCEIHALYGDLECPTCGKLFSFHPHLETHKRTHQSKKEFKCDLCLYSSHTKQGLIRHVETTHIGSKLKCPTCDFETVSSYYLKVHMKKHQGPDTFKCSECNLSTEKEDDMKCHLAEYHPELSSVELQKIMGKRIHNRNKMGRLASHKCQFCGQVFRKLCKLRDHIWQHKGINPYKCKLCSFETRSDSNLKSHMMRHSSTRNHLCDECGKAFKQKSALKTHCAVQHTNSSNSHQYCCQNCEFRTPKESDFKHHMESHNQHSQPSAAQTFRCYQCTQFTNTKEALRAHYHSDHPEANFDEGLAYEIPEERITTLNISIHHKDGVLHYKCSQCDVLLKNNGELGQHLRETHGLAITTSTEGDPNVEQLLDGRSSSQSDFSALPEGLQVHLIDSMSDKTSAEQLIQQIIDIQEIAAAAAQIDRDMNDATQHYAVEAKNKDENHINIPETDAAVRYLEASESLGDDVIEHVILQQGQEDLSSLAHHANNFD